MGTKVGGSCEAEDRTQERAAMQQEQDQGVGKREEPEAQATPLGNQERRLPKLSSSRLAQDPGRLGQGGADMIGDCGQDIGGSLAAEDRAQEQAAMLQERDQGVGQLEEPEAKATAARLLLQNKHLTFPEYQALEAKDLLASSEPEPDPVLGPLQSLGPGKGVFPRPPSRRRVYGSQQRKRPYHSDLPP